MKKKTLLMLAAILTFSFVLTSCSNDDNADPEKTLSNV